MMTRLEGELKADLSNCVEMLKLQEIKELMEGTGS